MPDWVMWLLFGVAGLALVWWFFQAKASTLPSGNTTSKPASVNAGGTQYGNLT